MVLWLCGYLVAYVDVVMDRMAMNRMALSTVLTSKWLYTGLQMLWSCGYVVI